MPPISTKINAFAPTVSLECEAKVAYNDEFDTNVMERDGNGINYTQ